MVVCHLRGRLYPEVKRAVLGQYPLAAFHEDQPYPLRSYADAVRTWWAGLGDLVIVEGDVIPPPGSIRALLDCPGEWCSHPSWVGDHYLDNTLGLVKFSQGLQRRIPNLADQALAREPFRGNHYDRGLGWEMPNRRLGVVAVDSSVLKVWPELEEFARERAMLGGTSIHPKAIDMALNRVLTILRVPLHVHQPPAPHLRYPETDPALRGRG